MKEVSPPKSQKEEPVATWKRHYKLADKSARMNLYRNHDHGEYSPTGSSKNYQSFLPEVYAGFPNRLDRFRQYDMMENDPEVNAALDILTDFCTQNNEDNDGNPFNIDFGDDTPDTIIETIQSALEDWVKINRLDRRIFDIVRSALKYGDYFFVRDPETFTLYPANPYKIEKVVVDESKGKEIEQYFIRDLEMNLQAQVATAAVETTNNYSIPGTAAITNVTGHQGTPGGQTNSQMGGSQSSRFVNSSQSFAVNAEHVIHLSMNAGDDPNWPFGTSVLEAIYKTYKQKELLEDSIIIYRIQRAPERRVFKIDVGNLPHQKAMQFVERMKQEMHQRRIPTRDGSGSGSFTLMDTAYNPMSILEDFYLPVTADGRGSDITTLPGGECLVLDTKIPLLDGRELTLQEMIQEYENGKQNWVYSCNPNTGEVVPGKVTWAGTTRKNAEVVKLIFDNGESVTVTPDHKFPILGKGFVEAKDLEIDESMIPFYIRQQDLGGHKKRGYTQVYDPSSKQWIYVHRLVKNFIDPGRTDKFVFEQEGNADVIHHADFDRFNNDPENLVWMDFQDHRRYHMSLGFSEENQKRGTLAAKEKMEWLKENDPDVYQDIIARQVEGREKWRENLTEDEKREILRKQGESLKEHFANLSQEEKEVRAAISAENGKNGWPAWEKIRKEFPERERERAQKASDSMKSLFINEPKRAERITKNNVEMWKNPEHYEKVFGNQTIKFSLVLLNRLVELAQISSNMRELEHRCSLDAVFMSEFLELNKDLNAPNLKTAELSKFKWSKRLMDHFAISFSDIKGKSKIEVSKRMIDTILKTSGRNIHEFCDNLGSEFINSYLEANPWKQSRKISPSFVIEVAKSLGYSGYSQMREELGYRNHRLIAIEYLDQKVDTGTLTIDGLHEYHDYHTFALSCGVFTKNSLGQIDDLRNWNNKLIRGLKIPSSYLPFGPDDGTHSFNDGRTGQVLVQEIRFAKYCQRLQNNFAPTFDAEFKRYLEYKGYNIDISDFDLRFNKPMNFAEWTKIEMLNSSISLFTQMVDLPFMSKRLCMEEFLQWDEEKIARNARMWREENPSKLSGLASLVSDDDMLDGAPGLQSVGIQPGDEFADEVSDESTEDSDFDNIDGVSSPLGGPGPNMEDEI